MHINLFKSLFLAAASLTLLVSCNGSKGDDPEPVPETDGFISIAVDSKTNYKVIYEEGLKSTAEAFSSTLNSWTGATFNAAKASDTSESTYEIIVGSKGRSAIEKALQNISYGYSVQLSGKQLVIAGTDKNWTILALEAFGESVLKNADYCKDGTLKLPEDWKGLKNSVKDPQMIGYLLNKNRKFTVNTTLAGTCPQKGVYKVAQGAASDGEYVYFVMKGNEVNYNSQCVVYKYTLKPFKYVAVSEEFNGHHANDMTFDTKNKRALVVNGSGASGTLTAIDANTLAISTITTSLGIGGMTYNPSLNIYGITQGGTKYQTADENFKMVKNFGRSDNTGYTAQGMGSDDYYVYFPMSPNSGSSNRSVNILVAYDWNGKYKGTIDVPLSMESESMFYAAGEYYVNFYSSGAQLYKISPVITYIPTAK